MYSKIYIEHIVFHSMSVNLDRFQKLYHQNPSSSHITRFSSLSLLFKSLLYQPDASTDHCRHLIAKYLLVPHIIMFGEIRCVTAMTHKLIFRSKYFQRTAYSSQSVSSMTRKSQGCSYTLLGWWALSSLLG